MKLMQLLSDIDKQPEWRSEAMRAADYYDCKQLTQKMIATLEGRDQPVMVHNLVAPTIDGVLGMEAKTRADMIVRSDDDEGVEVSEALNEKHNEFTRVTKTDRAVADAFAAQVKVGLGWVEVNRQTDPFKFPYQVNYVHRDEIWWDWHSKKPDLEDCRWLIRRRWVDEDEAIAYLPHKADLIKQACNGWADFADMAELSYEHPLMSAYQDHTLTNYRQDEFVDTERGRIRVYEVYYRVFEKGLALKLPDGRAVRFDRKNQLHQALVGSGTAQLVNAPYTRMKVTWYVGPHQVHDGYSTLPHNHFPYVPFWGFREDSTLVPYGLIRRMFSPQDEVNARRSKLTWLLNSKLVTRDSDAVAMSDQELIDEINRPDGIITLNPHRKNADTKGFWIEQQNGIAAQQFTVMQDAEKAIQECAGVFSAFLGQQGAAVSGIAINSLVEQGSTTLAELFDNYRFARQQVGELILAYIVSDMAGKPTDVMVNVNKPEPTKRIHLNQKDENGRVNNDVTRIKTRVVLDDIMNTPGYRAQLSQRMMELVQTLPDNLKVAVIDLVIQGTDVPKKEEFLKRIRRATGQGVNPEDMSGDEKTQWEQQKQQETLNQQLALEEVQAKIAKLQADAKKQAASAQKELAAVESMGVKDELVEAQTLKTLADLKQITLALKTAVQGQMLGQQHLPRSQV